MYDDARARGRAGRYWAVPPHPLCLRFGPSCGACPGANLTPDANLVCPEPECSICLDMMENPVRQ
jgi:hypothetical protein